MAAISLVGRNSEAGTITVDFELSGSTVLLNQVFPASNTSGSTMVSGNARLTLTGVNSQGMITGPQALGSLQGFDLAFAIDDSVGALLSDATLVGSLRATQIGTARGVLNRVLDGARLAVASGQFANDIAGSVDCMGSGCATLSNLFFGTFPVSVNAATANRAPLGFDLTGLDASAVLGAMFTFRGSGVTARFDIVGREVDRAFVPEPNAAGLLGASALGLLAFSAALRRRSRASI